MPQKSIRRNTISSYSSSYLFASKIPRTVFSHNDSYLKTIAPREHLLEKTEKQIFQ